MRKQPFYAAIRRLPFTLAMLAGLIIVAEVTNTHVSPIANEWLNRVGFAPNDLWYWRLERLFTSALTTSGGKVFWEALFFIAFGVGLTEWMSGTKRAAATFWGIHVLSLIFVSLIISLALHLLREIGLEASEVARDVGPSAGYFACLGLVSARLKRPWQWVSGGLMLLVFVTAIFLPPGIGESAATKFSADLAHLLAFPLGWLSSLIGVRSPLLALQKTSG